MIKKISRLIFILTSAILLTSGWYEWGTGLLLLIGIVPLLLLEDDITQNGTRRNNKSVYLYTTLTILLWNVLTTWWIKNATWAGMAASMLVTTCFMSFPVMIYSFVKYRYGRVTGYIGLVVSWLAFEFMYNHGEISWPWLSLGNGFMFSTRLIQWYEFTGIFGGSLWILLLNILIYEFIRKGSGLKHKKVLIISMAVILMLPVIYSLIRYYTYKEKPDPHEIVVVQPNIDPYLKFNDIPPIEQTLIQLRLANSFKTSSTDYIVCPETSIMNNIWIGNFEKVPDLQMVKSFVLANPRIKYITGIMCRQQYNLWNRSKTSHEIGNTGVYFDSYNSAIQYDTTSTVQIYHKSKLVVGVEKMPYPQYLKILQPLTVSLGGTFRSHATQEERGVFTSADDTTRIAPVICYESVYGEFVGDYIKNGAEYIFVITNDGWWGNTPGHRQHNALSALRAIETRRSVARSANTGISCFINQRGDILMHLPYWETGAMKSTLNANNRITFYTRFGDYIGRSAFYMTIILIVVIVIHSIYLYIRK